MKRLVAYHNNPSEKDAILKQLAAHRKADELIKGQYWQNGKGCAVGCTIHSSDHAEYEPRFGIPQMLARLEDCIFENLPNGKAKAWPERFMGSIEPGADLSLVGWAFLHWLLTDKKANPGIAHPDVRDAIKRCADLMVVLKDGGKVSAGAAYSARSAAYSAAYSARSARSARSAADSAAYSAYSAYSARSAADSARSAAYSAVYSAAYVRMSNKLIKLLKNAKTKDSKQ